MQVNAGRDLQLSVLDFWKWHSKNCTHLLQLIHHDNAEHELVHNIVMKKERKPASHSSICGCSPVCHF